MTPSQHATWLLEEPRVIANALESLTALFMQFIIDTALHSSCMPVTWQHLSADSCSS